VENKVDCFKQQPYVFEWIFRTSTSTPQGESDQGKEDAGSNKPLEKW